MTGKKTGRENRETKVQRYVNILSDAGFKAVFGEQRNKDVLIDLLNMILPPHRKVRSVTYSTTEIPSYSLFNKSIRLDLRCLGEDGTVFIVEVQCYHQSHFFQRCVLYASKVYDAGSGKGDGWDYDIPPVYLIGLIDRDTQDFQDCSPEDGVISEYTFREKSTYKVPGETIFCIFVELNRFEKTLGECLSLTDKWCYALKHIGVLDSLPENLRTEAFERLFKACEIAKLEPEVKLTYEKEMFTERDYYNIIETARNDGLAMGMAKGEAEGKIEGKIEEKTNIALKMKKKGYSISDIEEITGLTSSEIEALQ